MNKDLLVVVLIATVMMFALFIISTGFIIFKIRKDIEKRYDTKIKFPLYTNISPSLISKYSNVGMGVIVIFLTEKNFIKKNKYYKYVFLTDINYTAKTEKKFNIVMCFINLISSILFFVFLLLFIYIGSRVYKT